MAQEKLFENKVKTYLRQLGAWYIKYWAGAKFTKDGIPDILACYKKTFIAIEIKASDGKPSLLQLVTLDKIRKAGGIGVLLYPSDFIGFRAYINGSKEGIEWYQHNIEHQNEWFEKLK